MSTARFVTLLLKHGRQRNLFLVLIAGKLSLWYDLDTTKKFQQQPSSVNVMNVIHIHQITILSPSIWTWHSADFHKNVAMSSAFETMALPQNVCLLR